MTPIFSVCHTTARPVHWITSCESWLWLAGNPQLVEYILCVDKRWGFEALPECPVPEVSVVWKAVWNTGRKCMVDGYEAAAHQASGSILIMNSDDMFPPDEWDLSLLRVLADRPAAEKSADDFVIHVSSDTPADDRDLMVLQILSRERYRKLGYVFYPKYEGVYADDDFSEHARHDGVVIDARKLIFRHQHPDDAQEYDEVYQHQNRPEIYKEGAAILAQRKQERFRS